MPPAKTKPAQWIDLLISKAKDLREVGVLSLELEGCKVELAPMPEELAEVPQPTSVSESSMEKHMDALDDPDTYNMNGEGTPGYYSGRRQGPVSNDGARALDA